MKAWTFSAGLLLASASLFAQQAERASSLGLHGGITTYQGELNDKFFAATPEFIDLFDNTSYITWGADYEQYFGNSWAAGLLYTNGIFSASDREINWDGELQRDADNFNRALNVRTKLNDLVLYAQWSANNGKLLSETAFLSPFIRIGAGLTRFKTFGDLGLSDGGFYQYQPDGTVLFPDAGDNLVEVQTDDIFETELSELQTNGTAYDQTVLSLYGGLGLNFRFNDYFSMQLSSMFRPTFTDYLDDVSGEGSVVASGSDATTRFASNPAGNISGSRGDSDNDWYAQHMLTAKFYFGNRVDEFRAPIVVVGDLPLKDSVRAAPGLFKFDKPKPLKPMQITELEAFAPPSRINLQVTSIEAPKDEVRWVDSDGDVAPAIESEVPAGYNRRFDYGSDYPTNDVSSFEEEANSTNSTTRSTASGEVVTTYPTSVNDENLGFGDSLTLASQKLQRQLNDLRARSAATPALPDTAALVLSDQDRRIDSLTTLLERAESLTFAQDSLRRLDTVYIRQQQQLPATARYEQQRNPEVDRMKLELDEMRRERAAYNERALNQRERETSMDEARIESRLAEVERLRKMDKATIRNDRRDDRNTRKLAYADMRTRTAQDENLSVLVAEQDSLRNEIAKMQLQMAAMQRQQGIAPVIAAPLAPTTQKSDGSNAALLNELRLMRADMAALSARPNTVTTAPAPIINNVAPAANTDRRAQVFEALRNTPVTRVFFATGSATLTTEARAGISEVARIANRYDDYVLVSLEGFTDKTGNQASNQLLSQRRVRAVRTALEQQGVSNNAIRLDALGEDFDAADLAFGRRVEIRLVVR